MEIIKGPAAATLYGTEAPNGVIQIITKKGRAGSRPQITPPPEDQLVPESRGPDPANFDRDPVTGAVVSQNLVQQENDRGIADLEQRLQRELQPLGHGRHQRGAVLLSGNYDDDHGIDPTNKARRFAGHANLSFPISQKLDVSSSFNFIKAKYHLGVDYGDGVLFNTLYGLPILSGTPTRGFLQTPPEAFYSGVFDNTQDLARFTGSVTANHRPSKRFSHRLTLGFDQTGEDNQALTQFMPPDVAQFYDPISARGQITINRQDISFYTADYSATGRFNLSSKISSATSVGAQYYQRRVDSISVTGTQFPAPGFVTGNSTAIAPGGQEFVPNKTIGLFAQQQFGLSDRAFLTGAVRVDNNSAFGDNFDFASYPKLSGTWVVSEEGFWGLDFVNALKLRAAYGASGEQPQTFAALSTYQPSTGPNDEPIVTPQFVGNPDLKPERERRSSWASRPVSSTASASTSPCIPSRPRTRSCCGGFHRPADFPENSSSTSVR